MAFVHGKGTVITLDGNDLSAFITDSEFSNDVDSHDVTTYGNDAKVYQAGLTDATFSMEGAYDDTATGPKAIIEPLLGGAPVTLIRRPEGTGSGLPEESVSVIPTSYSETNPVADMVTWSCDFQCSGAITRSNQI